MMNCCSGDRKLVSQKLNAKNASEFRLNSHGGQVTHIFLDFFGNSICVSYAHLSSSHYIVLFSAFSNPKRSIIIIIIIVLGFWHKFVVLLHTSNNWIKNNNRRAGKA